MKQFNKGDEVDYIVDGTAHIVRILDVYFDGSYLVTGVESVDAIIVNGHDLHPIKN